MDIVHSIDIRTTPDRLYDAITTKQGLAAWWAPQTTAAPKVGALNEFRFGPELTATFRVDKLESGRHVSWSAVQVPPDWQGTQITFDITPGDNAVNIRLSQSGFTSADGNFSMYNYLWAQYVRSLKLLLETGTGEPFGSPASIAAHPLQ